MTEEKTRYELLSYYQLIPQLIQEIQRDRGKTVSRNTIHLAHLKGGTTPLRKKILEIAQRLITQKQQEIEGQKATA
jgi:hypothetical protein